MNDEADADAVVDARTEDVPALKALTEAIPAFLATELAPEDTRAMLSRVCHQRLDEIEDTLAPMA